MGLHMKVCVCAIPVPGRQHRDNRRACARAFTLIELLVVMAIIGVLLAILLPALNAGRETAHDLRCRANYRNVLIQFQNFADDNAAPRRGDSEAIAPRFLIEDFQESVYGLAEFWTGPDVEREAITGPNQPLMCPAGPAYLERRSNLPCSAGAVGPTENVTTAFNRRFFKETRRLSDGTLVPRTALLSSKLLTTPDAPLLFDCDGDAAQKRGVAPYYAAPPVSFKDGDDIYGDGTFWFPALRHRGRMNVGFIGGHVLSSANPLVEPYWKWGFQLNPM